MICIFSKSGSNRPLVPLLLEDPAAHPLEHLALDHPHPLDHQLVPELLQVGESSGPEEDEGVPEPVALPSEVVLVHESVGGSLVVGGRDLEMYFYFWDQILLKNPQSLSGPDTRSEV